MGREIIKLEPYFEYCNYGCKYEDCYGFCVLILNHVKKFPLDAFCKQKLAGFKKAPDNMVPARHYKKLKAEDKYGFK